MTDKHRQGILLVNTGTPAAPTPEAVRAYLSQFLMDRRIVPMNRTAWWFILHLFILPRRSRRSAAKYASIWGEKGSPLLVTQEELKCALQRAFEEGEPARPERLEEPGRVVVANGMSFGEPSIIAALEGLRLAGCERLLVLPLYPQSAFSTTAVVRDALQPALAALGWETSWQLIDNYHDNPAYVQAVAETVREAGFIPGSRDRLLFSYHSIPLKDLAAGDSYAQQCETSSRGIAAALGIGQGQWAIGYQCRFDRGRDWLAPFTKDMLAGWAKEEGPEGGGRVFLVCPGFALDCLETLYDVPQELQPHYQAACAATGNPGQQGDFVYVPCLNSGRPHVRALCAVVADSLNAPVPPEE